jgi:hypothetical protein
VKFLVDNQLPPALARFISEDLGVEAQHVTDIGLRDGADVVVWNYASSNDLILISKDEDFVTLYSKTPSAKLLGATRELSKSSPVERFQRELAQDCRSLRKWRAVRRTSLILRASVRAPGRVIGQDWRRAFAVVGV